MRTILAFLLGGVIAFALGTPAKVDEHERPLKVADKVFLEKQERFLRLFKYVFQPSYYKDHIEIAKNWHFEKHFDEFLNPKYVKEFYHYYKDRLLPRGEIFSIFNEVHRKQAVALFHVFYYAKDFETFYKVACWARQYVNEGMFIYSMHVAVFHRHDTEGIVLPPIYEINPYFFVHSNVIHKAHEYKRKFAGVKGKEQTYYVPSNYSGWYLTTNPEQHDLGYFYEDVALNSLYYYYHILYPFWMDGEEYGLHKDRRGELHYYVHKTILAKYYMERLSNGYGTVEVFDYHKPIFQSFEPSLRYPNGFHFPSRPANVDPHYNPYNQYYTKTSQDNFFRLQHFEDCENGTKVNLYEKDSFDLIGKMIESSPDSPNTRCYCHMHLIARQVLGNAAYHFDENKTAPSVLEHYETTLRDPTFYQIYKRIIRPILRYQENLPQVIRPELNWPGVKVESFHIDELFTYFDKFDFEITNAVYVNEEEFLNDTFHVYASQKRLNSKPFGIKYQVSSDKAQDAMIRVFMGPKFDVDGHEISISENWVNFMLIDKFVFPLKAGVNIIERNSKHFFHMVANRTSYLDLYKQVMTALKGEGEFRLDMSYSYIGFPHRFVLPKGKVGGEVFQFYVFVGPYQPIHEKKSYAAVSLGVGSRISNYDSFGYPFEIIISSWNTLLVPNAFRVDKIVYHKSGEELIN